MTPTSARRTGRSTPLSLPLSLPLSVLLCLLTVGPPGARCLDFCYHDATAMHQFLVQVTQSHPNITRLYSAGKSVQGGSLFWSLFHCHPDIPRHRPSSQHWQECSGWVVVAVVVMAIAVVVTQSYTNIPRLYSAGKGVQGGSLLLLLLLSLLLLKDTPAPPFLTALAREFRVGRCF